MDAYLGQVIMFAGANPPVNWHVCDGSLLNVSEYQALFTLLGATYGGDGIKTFGLPNLVGRIPIGAGTGGGLTPRTLAQAGGSTTAELTVQHIPAHTHTLYASSAAATSVVPTNMVCSQNTAVAHYTDYVQTTTKMNFNPGALTEAVGGEQQHANVMPSMAINFIICINGAYPTPN
ncbi:MAG: tail fiber protein [Pelosinus sp.]|nr:tail fiber protein [Pelosinus sp.]